MNCCDDNGRCTCGLGIDSAPAAYTGCTHDCEEGRKCTCKPVKVQLRSCNELGACQTRKPRCEGCTAGLPVVEAIRFAPGAVEGYRPGFFGSPAQRRELKRWLLPSLAFSAVVALAGLAVGLIAGRFFP